MATTAINFWCAGQEDTHIGFDLVLNFIKGPGGFCGAPGMDVAIVADQVCTFSENSIVTGFCKFWRQSLGSSV